MTDEQSLRAAFIGDPPKPKKKPAPTRRRFSFRRYLLKRLAILVVSGLATRALWLHPEGQKLLQTAQVKITELILTEMQHRQTAATEAPPVAQPQSSLPRGNSDRPSAVQVHRFGS